MHTLTYDDLAPYTDEYARNPATHIYIDEYGPEVPTADLLTVVYDGVDYITDRYVLIRADRLTGGPHEGQYVRERPDLAQRVRAWLHPDPAPGGQWPLHPYYLHVLRGAGLTPAPTGGKTWLILDDGEQVGLVQGCTPGSTLADHPIPPTTPETDLTRVEVLTRYLTDIPSRLERWDVAHAALTDLDAHDAAHEARADDATCAAGTCTCGADS